MTWANRFLGFALSATLLSGCAATSGFISSQLWPWKQKDSAPGLTADLSRPFPDTPEGELAEAREFSFSHPLIDQQISRFQDDQHGFYERALERSTHYVPVMEEILERNGVPRELAYLPLIESGYEPNAVSPAGAVGPWQFIYGTAVRYGLRVDRFVDERRDPIKSTEAAARYLHDLHDMFNDWHLALAAYNTGEGNIGRIQQTKGAETFWDMIGKGWLYSETEAYVPRYLAALQIAKNPELYGFEANDGDPISYDWVVISRPMPLSKVAELSDTDLNTLRQLNPALRRGAVPPSGYIVKLPKGSRRTYEDAIDEVDPTLAAWNPRRSGCDPDDGLHCVKRGDTYASIASRYGVSVRELLDVNGRRASHPLSVGEALIVPGHTPSDDDNNDTASARNNESDRPSTHTVRKGDTPATIAARYGMSTNQLLKLNGLKSGRNLKTGQKLMLTASAKPASASPNSKVSAATMATSHTVAKNDTPASIASRYGVTTNELLRANGLRDSRGLKIGQKLKLPASAQRAKAPAPTVGAKTVAAPQPMAKAAAAPMPAATVHKVRKGDTPATIASKYGVTTDSLMKANNLRGAGGLQIDQPLVIPSASNTASGRKTAPSPAASVARTYTIGKGDTPASIARRHNVSPEALLKANGLKDARGLMPGQKLIIPASQRAQAGTSRSDG